MKSLSLKNTVKCILLIWCYTITAFAQGSGLIEDLTVYDSENAGDWSIQTNLQAGSLQFGDRTYVFDSVPDKYLGITWIRTANDSKGFTGDTLVTFQVTDSVDVLIAYDDRLSIRDWLGDWQDTGDDLVNSETTPKTFSLYKKTFIKNSLVVLGSVNQTSGTNNYSILCQIPLNPGQTPDPFVFRDRFDQPLSTAVVSESLTISGLAEASPVSLSNGEYAINGSEFVSTPGFITNNDQIAIRLMTAADYGRVTTTRLNIGGVSAEFSTRTVDDPERGWAEVPVILSRIQPPVFTDHDFYITDFGAVGDSLTDCTEAFKNAIDACNNAGGGRVLVPAGTFLTGAIHLKSNVNLHLFKDAKIKFSQDPADFLPVVYTRFEGTECYNYSPPIYAFEQENIAVTGPGTIDGGGDADHWWPWKSTGSGDVSTLRQQAEDGIPVESRIYGEGHYLRPNMIQPYRCKNILIDSITVLNGPMWHIHPVLCENMTVSNVTVIGHGPNNDGCNPESSKDVLISNCYFDTGDDCIAVKSGRNADGRRINVPTENVIIRNCTMKDGHGGVVIGSEISGSARNIFAEECYMDSPNLERALRLKTNSMRGGIIENVYLRNISVGQVSGAAVRVNFYYQEGDVGEYTPAVKNIEVYNMTCNNSQYALQLYGYERSKITDLRLVNCTFNNVDQNNALNNYQNLVLNNTSINGEEINKIYHPVADPLLHLGKESKQTVSLSEIELLKNYPNPFNATTRIEYKIALKHHVRLSIYNTLGQQIAVLVDEEKNPGTHSVFFNASALSSGIYISRLEAGGEIIHRKICVIK